MLEMEKEIPVGWIPIPSQHNGAAIRQWVWVLDHDEQLYLAITPNPITGVSPWVRSSRFGLSVLDGPGRTLDVVFFDQITDIFASLKELSSNLALNGRRPDCITASRLIMKLITDKETRELWWMPAA